MDGEKIAMTILQQLGGNRFTAMTGSKYLYDSNSNYLEITLKNNKSKANRLNISLEFDDTYTLTFKKYTPSRLNKKTYQFSEPKSEIIEVFGQIHADQLQQIFTFVTGFDTTL